MKIDNYPQSIIDACKNQKYIAIDTEFIREDSYYPELCLLQICVNDEIFLIDPTIYNISKLEPIFRDNSICKIFHDCRQDLQILQHIFKFIPNNIFDTQLAAAFLGYDLNVSYASLVANLLDITLDKSLQYSNWNKRPLSNKQLEYAAIDVKYLYQIYPLLKNDLYRQHKLKWYIEDIELSQHADFYLPNFEEQAKKLKKQDNNLQDIILILKLRENIARSINKAKRKIITDQEIINITTSKKVAGNFNSNISKAIGDILNKEKAISEDRKFTKYSKSVYEIIKIYQQQLASLYKICSKIIATNSEIERLLLKSNYTGNLNNGWRHKIFTSDIIDFLSNEKSLSIDKVGKLVFK